MFETFCLTILAQFVTQLQTKTMMSGNRHSQTDIPNEYLYLNSISPPGLRGNSVHSSHIFS